MNQRTVIVTDGEQRSALAVVRSLGAAGYRCIVTSASHKSIAGDSRFVARTVKVPDALEKPASFAEAIIDLSLRERAVLVLPIAEPAMLALLAVRSRILPAVIPFPDLATFKAIADKRRVLEEAAGLGIATPAQTVLLGPEAISTVDRSALSYPIVIKPARSVGEHGGARSRAAVTYAADFDELRHRVGALPPAAFPVLLQQRIVGPGTGIFLLMWDGKLAASFAHRRLCEKPPSGGVSVYRESIPVDDMLLDRSVSLLQRFGWRGVAMVEYKRDAITGQPYLMEVNGRFWGSLQLAIDSGVDFPRLLASAALGDPFAQPSSYRLGVRSRWWWGQVDHLVSRLRPRAVRAPLPAGTPSATRALGDLLLGPFRRRDYEEVLRWTDPRPFLRETMHWVSAR